MIAAMSEKPHDSVLGSLPHSRPHRRSEKRAARPDTPAVATESKAPVNPTAPVKPTTPKAKPATPRAKPATPKPKPTSPKATKPPTPKATKPTATSTAARRVREPAPTPPTTPPEHPPSSSHTLPGGTELVGTVVKATAELAEIGLSVGARALRIALSRLPRP
jgi:outer membrane biosynthesis protein TonB